jgi:MFS superfamily sulfate permease-like transporter
VILDLDANDEIDITSADCLNKLADSLEAQHVKFVLAHVHQPALHIARHAGLLAKIDDDDIFPNIAAALAWAGNRDEVGPG